MLLPLRRMKNKKTIRLRLRFKSSRCQWFLTNQSSPWLLSSQRKVRKTTVSSLLTRQSRSNQSSCRLRPNKQVSLAFLASRSAAGLHWWCTLASFSIGSTFGQTSIIKQLWHLSSMMRFHCIYGPIIIWCKLCSLSLDAISKLGSLDLLLCHVILYLLQFLVLYILSNILLVNYRLSLNITCVCLNHLHFFRNLLIDARFGLILLVL